MLAVYTPQYEDLWFKQLMMSDEGTMSYNHAYGGTIPFPKEKWQEWYRRWISNEDGKKYYRYLKNDVDMFIGEISYHYNDEKKIYLADVVIYAKYRGKGYGNEALTLLCSIAKENNIPVLYDEIAVDNPAISLFLKHGFSEIDRTEETVILHKILYAPDLKANSTLELDYIVAVPRMAWYIEISSQIYGVYLKYVSPDDIHVYSIDEVFIDATSYLRLYKLTAREFAMKMIQDVLHTTGITATTGIGTNLYLCKIAMDIVAKHIPADKDGVRIAELDEMTYRRDLWGHQPLTDFWRVGRGYATKLEAMGLRTMGDIARLSEKGEDLLYRMFGINAELLIDHAWGWEPCTIAEIKAYKPESNSISSGQVLQAPYDFEKGRLVAREMTDQLALDLVEKHLITDQIVLTVGYDTMNLSDPVRRKRYSGPVHTDHYGRQVPKEAHGSFNLPRYTSSARILTESMEQLFKCCVNPDLLIRRITVVANHVIDESKAPVSASDEQSDLFTDHEAVARQEAAETAELTKEKRLQLALLDIKKKLGKNAVLKGMNLMEGATAKARNEQIGGHKK